MVPDPAEEEEEEEEDVVDQPSSIRNPAVETKKKAVAKAARQRSRHLKKMAADPTPFLRKTEQLVAERSIDAYQQISELLADLREALADGKQSNLAEKQALKLKTKNPTLCHLTAALRRKGFVPK